ncbi:MAG: hypothetical protein ACKPH7_06005 [Planktothrix sp.]|uniref:hypothetical protein n=2 Tax=Planktothrix sp. TaxID=3088171 RepID=UPI0038D3A4A2
MVAQISTRIETRIIYTYEDFDGVMVDVVEMTYSNGKTETRSCWTEENFVTGETVHQVVTRNGSILKSTWKTSQNNKWMTAYIDLWIKRYQAECEAFQKSMDTLAHPEFYTPEEYAQAKIDLGF